jgi:hypothetical protein
MSQPYQLARTYAPHPEFERHLSDLSLDPDQLCRSSGIHPSTYVRMQRLRTASRKTAERLACGFALAHGQIHPRTAFAMLFSPRPRVMMEPAPGDRGVFQRRRAPSEE